jgi:hypothetical protein
LWDTDKIRVVARLTKGGKVLQEIPLRYAGKISTFDGQLTVSSGGEFELEVLAMDPSTANFGKAEQKLRVSP